MLSRRWIDPFEEMRSMMEEMDRMMEEMWGGSEAGKPQKRGFGRSLRPPVEVTEDEQNVYVRAAVPGVPKDKLEITVEDDRVYLKGEVQEQKKEEKEGTVYSEMRYGAFERTIALPSEVKADEAKAEYHDGIVELTLPKKAVGSKGVKIRLE
ncbi:Hsp20/alpha crystallin family protein [Coprothermobacter platensis]|uniref:Hsp20/alpha crystallin family protein n=1 Tax=Coprothermobacter platensis TaxID=108819 RepID=UPI0003791DE4|nr:Hsp20/alpha crystallin family protein [Coprothermobacter platensis]